VTDNDRTAASCCSPFRKSQVEKERPGFKNDKLDLLVFHKDLKLSHQNKLFLIFWSSRYSTLKTLPSEDIPGVVSISHTNCLCISILTAAVWPPGFSLPLCDIRKAVPQGGMTMTRCDKENAIPAPCDFALLFIIFVSQILLLTLTLHQIEFIHDLQQILKNNSNCVNKKCVEVCMEEKRPFPAWISSKSI